MASSPSVVKFFVYDKLAKSILTHLMHLLVSESFWFLLNIVVNFTHTHVTDLIMANVYCFQEYKFIVGQYRLPTVSSHSDGFDIV